MLRVVSSEQWNIKRVDFLVELLYNMAQHLDYEFDKTHIRILPTDPVAGEKAYEEHILDETRIYKESDLYQ